MWWRKCMGAERPSGHNAIETVISIKTHKTVSQLCKLIEHITHHGKLASNKSL